MPSTQSRTLLLLRPASNPDATPVHRLFFNGKTHQAATNAIVKAGLNPLEWTLEIEGGAAALTLTRSQSAVRFLKSVDGRTDDFSVALFADDGNTFIADVHGYSHADAESKPDGIVRACNEYAALHRIASLAVQAAELGFNCPEVNEQLEREAHAALNSAKGVQS